jgi:hypothetical protein
MSNNVKISVNATPHRDTANSYPIPVTFEASPDGEWVVLDVREPERTLTFTRAAWDRIVAALKL